MIRCPTVYPFHRRSDGSFKICFTYRKLSTSEHIINEPITMQRSSRYSVSFFGRIGASIVEGSLNDRNARGGCEAVLTTVDVSRPRLLLRKINIIWQQLSRRLGLLRPSRLAIKKVLSVDGDRSQSLAAPRPPVPRYSFDTLEEVIDSAKPNDFLATGSF